MKSTIIGIDLAKNVFEVYVEDEGGQGIKRCRLSRKKMLPWFANRAPALVGMEACGGAHYWARELEKLGHTVRLMAPQYVKPWVQTNKSDQADARAICRAVQEPGDAVCRHCQRSAAGRASLTSSAESTHGQSDGPGEPDPWDLAGIRRSHPQGGRLGSQSPASPVG